MDSRQAILPDALRVNANPLPADLCRNPGYMDVFEIAIPGTGYPLPGGYDGLLEYLCNDERLSVETMFIIILICESVNL